MGSKRPFDGQESLQLPYKHSKQFASDEKLISFVDGKPTPIAFPSIVTNSSLNKPPLLVDLFEVKSIQEVHKVADGALVDGLHFPCITDSHGGENTWCGDFQRPYLPDHYFDSGSPRRVTENVVYELSSFLDHYPRKPVPVGANHQADIPDRESPKSSSSHVGSPNSGEARITDVERICMGTCVIPMPESPLPAQSRLPAGISRKDCDCADKASVRCVRQHVNEARDKLVKALGEETFRDLGFLDMGEEVANKWSEEEEEVFHAVVFSNPASSGKDFWSCLLEEFPTRSVKDIVSYYFNVFMLSKRAAQNRSRFLDIDSDDDGWHPGHGHSYDLDFAGEDDDGNYYSDEADTNSADDDEKESFQLNSKFSRKDNDYIPAHQDGSCSSFEYPTCIDNSSPTKTGVSTRIHRVKDDYKYVSSNQTEFDNGLKHRCLVDSSNIRLWDQGFSAGLDHLLPTENMIEEIFGPGSWDYKHNHD